MSESQRASGEIKKDNVARAQKPPEPNAPEQEQQPIAAPVAHDKSFTDPRAASPSTLLALQGIVGNRAVARMVQRKLTAGATNDASENDAGRVADRVKSETTSPTVHHDHKGDEEKEEQIQRKATADSISPLVQRDAIEEEALIQPKREASDSPFEAGENFENRLTAAQGNGSSLPESTRSEMENKFGADFGDVRVHTDGASALLNRQVSAQAFTHGSDIYMGEGKYNPTSSAGKQLLAHELTHVVQQSAKKLISRGIQRKDVQFSLARIENVGINVTSAAGGKGQKGHRMDVWVEIDTGENPTNPPEARPTSVYGLELQYWEFVNVHNDNQGPAGTKPWNDIYGMNPNFGTFDKNDGGCDLSWKQAVAASRAGTLKGKKKIGFTDYPGLYEKPGRNVKRTLEFRIVFNDGIQKREISATQVLEENNGQLGYTAYKDSLGNSVETHGFGGGAVTDVSNPLIAGHAGRLAGAGDNTIQKIVGTVPAGANALIPSFVELLKNDPTKAADFTETEKQTFLSRLAAPQKTQGGKDWDKQFSEMAKGDIQIAAGQFMLPDIPGTERKQLAAAGGFLVAIMKGTQILKMFYTDNITKTVNLMPNNAASSLNNIPMRSFTEIPSEVIQEQVKITQAMTTGKFRTGTMHSKEGAHLRAFERQGGHYIVKVGTQIGHEIKKGTKIEVDDPVIHDASGGWVKAKFGDTRGFIRASKVSYLFATPRPETYLYHVYQSKNLQDWAQIEQGTQVVDKAERKRIQAAANADRKRFGLTEYQELKQHLGTDTMLRFDDAHLRIDVAYTQQQLTELGGLYSNILGKGGGGALTEAGGLLSKMDVTSGDPEERTRKLIRNRAIYDKAVAAMQAYDPRTYDAAFTDRKLRRIENDLYTSTPREIIHSLLREYDGFLLAEKHSDTSSKEFLITNIDRLMGEGLDTIYIEHFRYREHQPYINQYLNSAATDPMPPLLQKLVDNLDRPIAANYPNNMKGLLEMAKRKHVRIIAMDDQAGLTLKPPGGATSQQQAEYGEARTTKMNYIAMGRIKEDEASRTGKYAVLLGAAHAHTHAGATTGQLQKGVAGLSQLLNLPAVQVSDDDMSQSGLKLLQEDKTKRATLAS